MMIVTTLAACVAICVLGSASAHAMVALVTGGIAPETLDALQQMSMSKSPGLSKLQTLIEFQPRESAVKIVCTNRTDPENVTQKFVGKTYADVDDAVAARDVFRGKNASASCLWFEVVGDDYALAVAAPPVAPPPADPAPEVQP